jgi:hypothetical protein
MPVMLLALALSDAALNAHQMNEYRISDPQESGGSAQLQSDKPQQTHPWTPGVTDWSEDKRDCPVFFQQELKGFGTFKVGPRCSTEPHR